MTISVIIPVLHEQERINEVVAQLMGSGAKIQGPGSRGQGPVKLKSCASTLDPEIIIVDGDPTGSTFSTITDNSIIRLIAPAGRGSQLAAGAAVATGEILLLLHADTQLPETAFSSIRQAVANGADWGAFRLGIDASPLPYRIIELAVDLRCRLFKLPYGDQAMFVTRAALSAVGGIPHIPLMEDVALARMLAKTGQPFTLLPERVCTSARRWQQDGIVRRTCKNWWLLLRYLTGVKPEKLAKDY